MRKIIFLFCLILLFNFPMIGYCDTNMQPSTTTLTLDNAIELAKNQNLDLKLIDKKIEIYEQKLKDAKENSEEVRYKYSSSSIENLNYRKADKLYPKQVELQLDTLKNERVEKYRSVIKSVKQQFNDVITLKIDVDIINEEIKNMDKQIVEAKLKVQQGKLKEIDYKNLQSQRYDLLNRVNLSNTQYNNALIELKKLLGLEVSKKIVLTGNQLDNIDISKYQISTLVFEKNILTYVENCFSVLSQTRELELKKLEKQITQENTNAVNDNKETLLEIDLNIEVLQSKLYSERFNREADLWIEYYDLETLKENVESERLNLEIENLYLDAATIKARLGMVKSMDEIDARISYSRQKNNYQRSMYNYILAVEQFNEKLGTK